MKKIVFILMLLSTGLVQAELTLQSEKTHVAMGQTFRVVLTLDGNSPSGVPDLTPLQTDFNIVGTAQSTSYGIVNGHSSSTSQWTLILMPKRTGAVTIPAIHLGAESTQPLLVNVTAGNDDSGTDEPGDSPKPVMLKADVDHRQPRVNEQVIYTIRLYNSRRLLDTTFEPPIADDALFIPLGHGQTYQTLEHGRIYLVEEQKYAVFPQKSGSLKISGPRLNALVYDDIPRQIKVTAKTIALQVKPAPLDFKGKDWLPATQMKLSEIFDRDTTTLMQGSTLIRTITLQATGLPAQLLPTLSMADTAGVNVYSEKSKESNKAGNNGLIGTKTTKVTYLFNKVGKIQIPSQQLHWFNTVTGHEEVLSLPEWTVNVTANPAMASTDKSVDPSVGRPAVAGDASATPRLTISSQEGGQSFLAWWLALGFASIWLLTLLLWWKCSRRVLFRPSRRNILKSLHNACVAGQPKQAKKALLCWAALQWPDARLQSLVDLYSLTGDPVLNRQLDELTRALYQRSKTPWHGEALWQSIRAYKMPSTSVSGKKQPLPLIYPPSGEER